MTTKTGDTTGETEAGARLMLTALSFIWGTTWPLMKVALTEVPPLSMRAVAATLGAVTLYLICIVMRRSLRIPSLRAWLHVTVVSVLTVVGFSLFSTFAQLAAATSRVTILAYTMPIWSVLLAWPLLGERPSRIQALALLLCAAGIAILVIPLTGNGIPLGLVFAVATGMSWAAGTVYLKWVRIDADPLGIASWQMTIAAVVLAGCMVAFEGRLHLAGARGDGWFAMIWTGVIGNGVAYALWFNVVRLLPAVTASLGVLAVPVIGIVMSFLILGEIPTTADMIGFTLIFAASCCVLLPRRSPAAATP